MRFTALALVAAACTLFGAACFGGGEPDPTPPPPLSTPTTAAVPEATVAATAIEAPAAVQPPWELPRTEDVPGVLLADWGPREGWDGGRPGATSAALLPLHAATAGDLPGYEPFDFGHFYTTAVSPDGALLAAVIGPTQDPSSTGLAIIDLASWTTLPVPDDLPSGIDLAGWSADGGWVYAKREDYISGLVSVFRVSRDGSRFELVIDALETRTWGRVILSPDRRTLYVPGYDGKECCAINVEVDPYIVAIDAATGLETARVALPDVGMGQGIQSVQGGAGEYNVSLHPALALSPDGTRIYIAHAGEDLVTVVATATMAVTDSKELKEPRSALSPFGSWLRDQLVSVAEAKGGLSSFRTAAFSGDGRYLLVTGEDYKPCQEIEYSECTIEPLGLLVVDAETLELVARIEDVDSVAVTPDGRYWLGAGDFWDWRTRSGNARVTGHGLKVIDAQTFEVAEHVRPGQNYLDVGAALDGRYAYLVSEGEGYVEDASTHVRSCEEDCWRVTVLDLESLSVIAERSLASAYLRLVSLSP